MHTHTHLVGRQDFGSSRAERRRHRKHHRRALLRGQGLQGPPAGPSSVGHRRGRRVGLAVVTVAAAAGGGNRVGRVGAAPAAAAAAAAAVPAAACRRGLYEEGAYGLGGHEVEDHVGAFPAGNHHGLDTVVEGAQRGFDLEEF